MDIDTEQKVTCPYNVSHRILKRKLGAHLYKCRKQHPHITLAICDFNATHHIPEGELRYHHQYCPSRKKIEAMVYQEDGNSTTQYPVHNITVKTDENWDDLNVTTYNAEEYCMRHGVLRKLDVAPPSKKKGFKMQERERLKIVESPICDVIETHNSDKDIKQDRLAKHKERISALRVLLDQSISMNMIHVCKTDVETYRSKNAGHAPNDTEETCAKQVQQRKDNNVICDRNDEKVSGDNSDRLAVLKDLIRRGMKKPFTPK